MSLEHWKDTILRKPGEHQTPTFFITEKEPVGGSEATVRYLIVQGGDDCGLEEGLYVKTNIRPEIYDQQFQLRSLITSYVALNLITNDPRAMKLAKKRDEFNSFPFLEESEYRERTRPVCLQPAAMDSNGGRIVLRLS